MDEFLDYLLLVFSNLGVGKDLGAAGGGAVKIKEAVEYNNTEWSISSKTKVSY